MQHWQCRWISDIQKDIDKLRRHFDILTTLADQGVTGLKDEIERVGNMLICLDAELETALCLGEIPRWFVPADWEFPFADLYREMRQFGFDNFED